MQKLGPDVSVVKSNTTFTGQMAINRTQLFTKQEPVFWNFLFFLFKNLANLKPSKLDIAKDLQWLHTESMNVMVPGEKFL